MYAVLKIVSRAYSKHITSFNPLRTYYLAHFVVEETNAVLLNDISEVQTSPY